MLTVGICDITSDVFFPSDFLALAVLDTSSTPEAVPGISVVTTNKKVSACQQRLKQSLEFFIKTA